MAQCLSQARGSKIARWRICTCARAIRRPIARAMPRSPAWPTFSCWPATSPISAGRPEARILAEDLRSCTIPVVGVLGNHDHHRPSRGGLRDPEPRRPQALDGQKTWEVEGVGFVGVKGFAGGFGKRMLESFGEPDQAVRGRDARRGDAPGEWPALDGDRARDGRPTITRPCRHHRRRAAGVLPFLGSSRLAETIDRFKVSAIVHGHARRPVRGRTPGGCRSTMLPRTSRSPQARLRVVGSRSRSRKKNAGCHPPRHPAFYRCRALARRRRKRLRPAPSPRWQRRQRSPAGPASRSRHRGCGGWKARRA